MLIRSPQDWELPESRATDEAAYWSRRRFLRALGAGSIAATGLAVGGRALLDEAIAQEAAKLAKLKAKLNAKYKGVGRTQTAEHAATRYNNFYEFSLDKDVWKHCQSFKLDPYALEIDGLVDKPQKLSLKAIEKLGLEQRVYRFRCVEAWSMTVPWTGVPLATLLKHVGVKSKARYVAFKSFLDPKQARGQRNLKHYKWPYYEALRLDEALNELALVVTGIYGKRLPPQCGAPLRIIVPWKYGYKGAKSVVKITLTDKRPRTFWNDAQPKEYGWLSNVEPKVPHPRWSQAHENHIVGASALGMKYTRIPTQPYNGYEAQVASLYGAPVKKLQPKTKRKTGKAKQKG